MHAYALLPSIPWITHHWVYLLAVGVALRIAYEWVGTYRRDRTWSTATRTTLLVVGGVMWAPLFLSPR